MLLTWIEHVASPLPRECSTTELQELRFIYTKHRTGAGEGNRTLVLSLEGFGSTIELHPRDHFHIHYHVIFTTESIWWGGLDSNQRTLSRSDLQSDAINHSTTSPHGTQDYSERLVICQYLLAVLSKIFLLDKTP